MSRAAIIAAAGLTAVAAVLLSALAAAGHRGEMRP